jgi:AcrR family transcriptional regulator
VAPLPEHLKPMSVGRHALARDVMDQHQRDRIVEASIEVFAKRGYQATTIDHIVAAAQVGVGSFYSLLDGKEDCFLRAYDGIVAATKERIAAASPSGASWPEQACAALRELLAQIAAEPLRARIVLIEVQTAGPVARARYQATLDEVIALIRRGRELSPVAKELPSTLEEATASGLAWLLHQQLAIGEAESVKQLFPDLAGILLEPYLGKAETQSLIVSQLAVSSPGG